MGGTVEAFAFPRTRRERQALRGGGSCGRWVRARLLVLSLIASMAGTGAAASHEPEQGFAFMDVTDRTAVFWTRASVTGRVELDLKGPRGSTRTIPMEVDSIRDFVATTRLRGLKPATTYAVEVRLPMKMGKGWTLRGELRTAPERTDPAPVRLAFGGDVGGQNVCRDAVRGYPLFGRIAAREPDLFVGLGDMIYADGACDAQGLYGNAQVPGATLPATGLGGFRARWRYNRTDADWIALAARTPYVPVWDDHEVIDDFGPKHDSPADQPELRLMRLGRRAFLENNPVAVGPGTRLHRRLRWGRHLELFVLDTRQHRDANSADDDFAVPKTMLGQDQIDWLLASLTISDATWNVVVSSVPISIPTGAYPDPASGRDGWANYDQGTGFEVELRKLLINLYEAGVRNLIWITTDVHFASVLRYRPFERFPDFVFYEVATGPLSAGVRPSDLLDDSFHPERLFRWPPTGEGANEIEIASFDEALHWFNFGELEVDAEGLLTIRVVNGEGRPVYEETLPPATPKRSNSLFE